MDIKRFLSPHRKIEHQLFEITQILTLVVMFSWSVGSFFAGYTVAIKVLYLSALAIFGTIYFLFKRNASFDHIAILYYGFAFILLALGWLPSGGIDGPITSYFVLIFVSGLLVLPAKIFLYYVLFSVVLVVGYSVYEYQYPDAANVYVSRLDEIRDLSIFQVMTLTLIGISVYFFKKSHQKDRNQLNRVIRKLGNEMERAASADRAKSKFLATISHEMRTPLNGIIGLTELLGTTKLSKEQKDMLGSLSYSSDLLHSLISDVLDLSLIEDDKLVLQKNEIDVKRELNDILEIFRRRLESKSGNISLTYDHDDSIPSYVFNDITRFKQILINLINNAIKFTLEGYVVVKSELKQLSSKRAVIEFSVSDTGGGIPEEKKRHVFEKFYKASDNQTVEGSGLGLSICKNLVEAMNGKIDFESEEGVGTIFYFELPFERETKENLEVEEAESSNSYGLVNVLVAEDVKINQMVISKMLKNMGVKDLDIVENGELAVNKAKEKDYDFILMDVQMPKMNGIDASRKILSEVNGAEKKPIIVAITANVMSGEKEECKRAGMSDFISKPITSEMLKEVFDRHLQMPQSTF